LEALTIDSKIPSRLSLKVSGIIPASLFETLTTLSPEVIIPVFLFYFAGKLK
jgi:hypothetical protein